MIAAGNPNNKRARSRINVIRRANVYNLINQRRFAEAIFCSFPIVSLFLSAGCASSRAHIQIHTSYRFRVADGWMDWRGRKKWTCGFGQKSGVGEATATGEFSKEVQMCADGTQPAANKKPIEHTHGSLG
jgi:uncharacterized protein YceK